MAGCNKQVRMWDLCSNKSIQVGVHDAPIKTCHWIKTPNHSYLMTGSWDKTLKFWDTRSSSPMLTINLPDKCHCVAVDYPMALVGTADKQIIIYTLEGQPHQYSILESPLKYQHRCVAIFRYTQSPSKPITYSYSMQLFIYRDKNKYPAGFALGSLEGRVAIEYVNQSTKNNFTFKCHRSVPVDGVQDIYAVNDVVFHPIHGTLATVGSDGYFSFWDKDSRTKLKSSETMGQPITKCAIDHTGHMFAYAVGYDWSKGHEFYNNTKKSHIFVNYCNEDMKPKKN